MRHHAPTRQRPLIRSARRVMHLAVAATALSVLAACSSGTDEAGPGRPALTVETVAPVLHEIPRRVPASGAIAAWQEVVIGVELSGLRVAAVEADVGQQVHKGDVLARIDRSSLESDVVQADAGLAEAVAAAAEARANADRARALAGRGALSARETDQLVTASARADAQVESAKAQLANVRRRLAYATVVAPDDGVISARNVTPGEVVGAGSELFRLIRQGRIEWQAEVPERDFAAIVPGMTAQIEPIGAVPVAGNVRTVSPGLDPGTRRGIAYVDLPSGSQLRPGMYVSGHLDLGSSQGRVVPLTAVTTRDGSHYVFTLGDDLHVREVKINIGTTVGDWIEVVDGLQGDARVVKGGAGFLRDGDFVSLADDSK